MNRTSKMRRNNLTPKSLDDGLDPCLVDLVRALEEAKEKKASRGDEQN